MKNEEDKSSSGEKQTPEKVDDFKIPVESLFEDFEKHLNLNENKRIFVSGKFGIGKTYFLNEFFTNNKDKYEAFHLFPVQYQIESNQNIIELIKYDLLLILSKKNNNDDNVLKQTLEDSKDLKKIYLSVLKALLDPKNISKGVESATSLIGTFSAQPDIILLGKVLGKPFKDVNNLKEIWKEVENAKKIDEEEMVEYILENNEKICEPDLFSNFLKKCLDKIKEDKKTVLIIDDLDRIDPEQIFRILNAFSAYLDLENPNKEIGNKLGFDKVILVGNYKNIKNIFLNKYGKGVDFEGYYDKFCNETYHYRPEKIIKKEIPSLIEKTPLNDKLRSLVEQNRGYVRMFLDLILNKWVSLDSNNKLSLRKLLKLENSEDVPFGQAQHLHKLSDRKLENYLDLSIKCLLFLADDEKVLLGCLTEIKNNLNREKSHRSYEIFGPVLQEKISMISKDEYSNYIDKHKIKEDKLEFKETGFEFFYDLLIEYIKVRGYKKEKIHDYIN